MSEGSLRVIVVEDDEDMGEYVRTLLERRAGCTVLLLADADAFAAHMRRFGPDVVLTDVELPEASGLDLVSTVRAIDPHVPVVVMTAHASVDYAVRALRERADEFLQKPLDSAQLVATVRALAARAREVRAGGGRRVVLAIGAHPDDVEIGVGGTLLTHVAAGDEVVILTLSRGARGGDADDRQQESLDAAERLGARLFLEDLVDTRIGNADPTVGIIERVVDEVRPDVVYTHLVHDRHQDHRAVHEATLVATRSVDVVACYQSPSSTVEFRPTRFVAIDAQLEAKLALLACFASQTSVRSCLEPDLVVATARYWSRFGSGRSNEPLEVVRDAIGVARVGSDDAGAGREGTRGTMR